MSDALNLEGSWFSLPLNYLFIWNSNLTSILLFLFAKSGNPRSLLPPSQNSSSRSISLNPGKLFPMLPLFKAPSVSEIMSQANCVTVGNSSRAAARPHGLTSMEMLEWAGFPRQVPGLWLRVVAPGMLCVHFGGFHEFTHSFIYLTKWEMPGLCWCPGKPC